MTHSELLEKFNRDLNVRNLSQSTIGIYMGHMRNFFRYFHHRNPKTITNEQIRNYMFHLLSERKYSAAYVIGAFFNLYVFLPLHLATRPEFQCFSDY